MKKAIVGISGLLMLAMLMGLQPVASAWSVTEWKTKSLPMAGDVNFTSSFSGVQVDDTITITISSTDGIIAITGPIVGVKKVTPKPKFKSATISVSRVDDKNVEVTFVSVSSGAKTVHLRLYLTTGEHVGVNAHFVR